MKWIPYLLLGASLLAVAPPGTAPRHRDQDAFRLDGSGAFFHPAFAADPRTPLAALGDEPLRSATYLRYLAGRFGRELLAELAFDVALARECRARDLVASAPALARALAVRRVRESERRLDGPARGELLRKFAAEALRKLRVDALVKHRRQADPNALRELFERRYGPGGVRVRARQVLVSFAATRRRLQAAGKASPSEERVRAAARARAEALRRRLLSGEAFAAVLAASDDRAARRALRDRRRAARAGELAPHVLASLGERFRRALSDVPDGGVSPPIETRLGYHVVLVEEREVTRLHDVKDRLLVELASGGATPREVEALRRELLSRYGYRPL